MPGSVSDAYDPEWGTAATADEIRTALGDVYVAVSKLLNGAPPMYILNLLHAPAGANLTVQLTEKELRQIRFALERAGDSI